MALTGETRSFSSPLLEVGQVYAYPIRVAINPLLSTIGWLLPVVISGDIIVSVNSSPVASLADVQAAVDAANKAGRKAVLLQVERNGSNRFVALPVMNG